MLAIIESDRLILNRRSDPRTNRLHSLRNLLRGNAVKFNWPLIALGNSEDQLIAASCEDHQADGALLRASRSGRLQVFRPEGRPPGHSTLKFQVGEQALNLVAIGRESGHEGRFPGLLESVLLGAIAHGVRRIFAEPNSVRPRGDEDPILHDPTLARQAS